MNKIKGLENFLSSKELIYVVINDILTEKEMKKLEEYRDGRPIFVRYKNFEQLTELEVFGFVRLEERIQESLFFAFDLPESNRKNLYVLEETTEYIDEKIKYAMPFLKTLQEINSLDNRLNFRGILNKKTPIFYETFSFYNVAILTAERNFNHYTFKAFELEHGKEIKGKKDWVLEKDLNEALHDLLGKFIRE